MSPQYLVPLLLLSQLLLPIFRCPSPNPSSRFPPSSSLIQSSSSSVSSPFPTHPPSSAAPVPVVSFVLIPTVPFPFVTIPQSSSSLTCPHDHSSSCSFPFPHLWSSLSCSYPHRSSSLFAPIPTSSLSHPHHHSASSFLSYLPHGLGASLYAPSASLITSQRERFYHLF